VTTKPAKETGCRVWGVECGEMEGTYHYSSGWEIYWLWLSLFFGIIIE